MLSNAKRMAGVFMAPRRTFTLLRGEIRHEDWLIPILIITAVGIIGGLLLFPDALEYSAREQLQHIEDIDWATRLRHARLTGLHSAYSIPIGRTLLIFLVAFIYWGLVFLFRGRITYQQTLTVISYSFLVEILEAIITVPFAIADKVTSVQIQLELFVPEPLKGNVFFDYLLSISVFDIWKFSLLGLGLIIVGKIQSKTAQYCFFLFLLVLCLSSTGMKSGPSIRYTWSE